MSTLRFDSQGQSFVMDASIEEDSSLQSLGDAYVQVTVQSKGFTGHNDLWLQYADLRQFVRQLTELNETLAGEARVISASPNELELIIRAVSSRGNLGILGNTGYWVLGENDSYWHSVSFGFEIEPNQLSAALQGSWLRRYWA